MNAASPNQDSVDSTEAALKLLDENNINKQKLSISNDDYDDWDEVEEDVGTSTRMPTAIGEYSRRLSFSPFDGSNDICTLKNTPSHSTTSMNAERNNGEESEEDDDDATKPIAVNHQQYNRQFAFSPADTALAALATEAARNAADNQLLSVPNLLPQSTGNARSTVNKTSTRRKSPPGTTTARQTKKSLSTTKIKIGCRVYTKRKEIFHILANDEQRSALQGFRDDYRLYGTVVSGGSNKGYVVLFDVFPVDHKKVQVVRRRLTVVQGNENESQKDGAEVNLLSEVQLEEEVTAINNNNKRKKGSSYADSIKTFANFDRETLREAKVFDMRYGDMEDDVVKWKILSDTEHITKDQDPLKYPNELDIQHDINFDEEKFDTILFRDFFPSISGHARLMDEYLADTRATYYATVKHNRIKFHDNEDDDPDWIIRQCYLLLIAAVYEADVGVENLWKTGESGGRHQYANFGQYVPKINFKAFLSCAAFLFCDKKYWYVEDRDRGWETFEPVLVNFNDKRKELFKVSLLMLDESMSGWRPKTTKLGGLPNITFEPRKPVPLGTQLKNGVECLSGVLAFQDVVQAPEVQKQKGFFYNDIETLRPERSSLPTSPEIQAHTAEVLRQVEGAEVEIGGWVGGDAWFGSVMTCVEVMKHFAVHSTFIVKNNQFLFPMAALHAVLKARHGDRPAGHWVVMKTEIAKVKLIAIAYAWSQKGISYFISTCGSTIASPIKYESKFENDWGEVDFKEVDRPDIVHFLYEYLPLIDEHNKQRQSLLCLERRWLTKDPWFRLLSTIFGMSVVDMHRLYRYDAIKNMGVPNDEVDSIKLLKFTDLICGNLRLWKYKQKVSCDPKDVSAEGLLVRCQDTDGNISTEPTAKQKQMGIHVGNPVVLSCFICRRYLGEDTKPLRRKTSFWCKDCTMPICKMQRRGEDGGRSLTCIEEHKSTSEMILGCNTPHIRGANIPDNLQICLHNRRSKRIKR
jgi:hypothetical protein